MDALARANAKNPAVKRLLQEYKELSAEQSRDFVCEPLEDNIFEWHFVLRGPRDTEFEGGLFHGRILLPPEYPFKPPTFAFLSPNGRFEVNTKICLSISTHHPEHWQPSWSLRTALTALIAFFPTKGDGAIGALDYPPQERRTLAAASRAAPPLGGQSEARAAVTRELHERMLAVEALPPSPSPADTPQSRAEGVEGVQGVVSASPAPSDSQPTPPPSPAAETQAPLTPSPAAASAEGAAASGGASAAQQLEHAPCADGCGASCFAAVEAAARDFAARSREVPSPARAVPPAPAAASPPPRSPRSPSAAAAAQRSDLDLEAEERRLVRAAYALAVAIAAILLRRAVLWASALTL